MRGEEATFGGFISESRKKHGLSQKELAARIQREEGGAISPQYLNDIEHDRRSPSSDHMVQQFASVLSIDANYLYYLAGRVPEEARKAHLSEAQVSEWMAAFRRTLPLRKGS